MPRLSVALSAGTTMSRLMRSTIFISRDRTYYFRVRVSLGGARRCLDESICAVLTLIDHRDPAVRVMPEYEKRLVLQIQLHDGVGDRQRLCVQLLGLDHVVLGVRAVDVRRRNRRRAPAAVAIGG